MRTTLRLFLAGTACVLVSALPTTEAALSTEDLSVRVVCSEALRAPRTERRAVFGVVMERARLGGWWGDSVRNVLLAKHQFASPWNPWCSKELPDRDDGVVWSRPMVELHARLLREIRQDVQRMMTGDLQAPLSGATYFHARRLGDLWPHLQEFDVPSSWRHRFYR